MESHNSRFKIQIISGFKTYLIFSLALLLCAFGLLFLASCDRTKRACPQANCQQPTPQIKQISASSVESICSAIYKGDFAGARELLGEYEKSKSTTTTQLTDIVSKYEAIEKKRQSAHEAAYQEQLAELEKLQAKPVLSQVEGTDANASDVNDVNGVGDANSIPEALLVVTRACEFANEKRKEELLSKPFVKQTIQKAKDAAAEYESKGKWLDAYITCYSWLQAIEPNNEVYSNYAEQLMDKAGIAATFQDSPCETLAERFQGVQKEIFLWVIDFLEDNYVDIIDYKQMATAAVNRCKLLGEVAAAGGIPNFPATGQVAAWSSALSAILDDVDRSPVGFSKDKFLEVFEKVLALNSTTVELPQPVLIAHFSEAALAALDPYTTIVWPRQTQDFQKTITNEFTGIGIEITKQKGLLTVASLLPDTPAYESGLDADDVIEKIDGVQTKDMTLDCAVRKITGPKGTKVKLTIKRAGAESTEDITIIRAKIIVQTLRGWERTDAGKWLYMIDDQNKIGYVRITSFSEKTSADLEKVLNELEAEGLMGLILDLRFNSGGLLDSAVAVADKFLKEGLIVRTERGFGKGLLFEAAHRAGTHPDYPLVILINSGSASASEIVAGALADATHDRAILVGERTYGKGSVQGIMNYRESGAQLKYTMAHYYLPSGQKVESRSAMKKKGSNAWGVGPNIEIKLRSDELKKLIEVQRDNDVLVKAGHDSSKQELKKHTIEETLSTDPQLETGTLIIKTKLIESQAHSQAG